MYTILFSSVLLMVYPCRGSILNYDEIERGIQQFKNVSDLSRGTCSSSENQCYCSFTLGEPLKLSVGFKLKYIPSKLAVETDLFIDDNVFNMTISIKNPTLSCIIPLNKLFIIPLNICLKLYNFNPKIPDCISGCVEFVAIFEPARAKIPLGCFHIPLQKGLDKEQCGSTIRNNIDIFLLIISSIFNLAVFNSVNINNYT